MLATDLVENPHGLTSFIKELEMRSSHEQPLSLTLLAIGTDFVDSGSGHRVVAGLSSIGPARLSQRVTTSQQVSGFRNYDLTLDTDLPLNTFVRLVGHIANQLSAAVFVRVNTYGVGSETSVVLFEQTIRSIEDCDSVISSWNNLERLIRPPYDTTPIAWSIDQESTANSFLVIRRVSAHGEWLAVESSVGWDRRAARSYPQTVPGLAICDWADRLADALHSRIPYEEYDICVAW